MLAAHWLAVILGLVFWGGSVSAHPLAPALLELREQQPGEYAVLWRSSLTTAVGRAPQPRLPEGCEFAGPIASEDRDGARSERWPMRCRASLSGQSLAVDGLEGSGINVIVRLEDRVGRVQQGLLSERQPEFRIGQPQHPPPVFSGYLSLGFGHLLGGLDHVLLVCGLVLLIRRPRRLLLTVSAFTLGHSLTLSLAALKLLWVPQSVAELAIAASLFGLACELVRSPQRPPGWIQRWPGAMATAFGLLHGLGFAGALADVGLPAGEIPLALLAFNLGIELGQLLLVLAMLAALAALASAPTVPWRIRLLPGYLIGTLSAYWCLDRMAGLFST